MGGLTGIFAPGPAAGHLLLVRIRRQADEGIRRLEQ
jgi:hypothetical protein